MLGFGKKKLSIAEELTKLPTRQTRKAWLKDRSNEDIKTLMPHMPRKERRLVARGLVKRGMQKFKQEAK